MLRAVSGEVAWLLPMGRHALLARDHHRVNLRIRELTAWRSLAMVLLEFSMSPFDKGESASAVRGAIARHHRQERPCLPAHADGNDRGRGVGRGDEGGHGLLRTDERGLQPRLHLDPDRLPRREGRAAQEQDRGDRAEARPQALQPDAAPSPALRRRICTIFGEHSFVFERIAPRRVAQSASPSPAGYRSATSCSCKSQHALRGVTQRSVSTPRRSNARVAAQRVPSLRSQYSWK